MKHRIPRKVLSLLLALVMVFTVLPLTALGVTVGEVPISPNNFPDYQFRLLLYDLEGGADGVFTREELENILYLNCDNRHSDASRKIRDLTGIEYFTNLKELYCQSNLLDHLDLGRLPKLQQLHCGGNKLISLDLTAVPELTHLYAGENMLTELDLSKTPKLHTLYCPDNRITALDTSANPDLITLNCARNPLMTLDVTGSPELLEMDCSETRLLSLDLSNCPKIDEGSERYPSCFDDQYRVVPEGTPLSEIVGFDADKVIEVTSGGSFENGKVHYTGDFANLVYVYPVGNGQNQSFSMRRMLTDSISVFPDARFREYLQYRDGAEDGEFTWQQAGQIQEMLCAEMGIRDFSGVEYFRNLKRLSVSDNQLTELDVTRNPALERLECPFNQLTVLDVTKNPKLYDLDCGVNQLTTLDISQNPAMKKLWLPKNQLTHLDITPSQVLEDLNLAENTISYINLDFNPTLTRLNCEKNRLRSLDLSQNTGLKFLDCSDNPWLYDLDLTHCRALEELDYGSTGQLYLDLTQNPKLHRYSGSYCSRFVADGAALADIPGMQLNRISGVTGGTITADGLKFDPDSQVLSYYYQCSGKIKMPFAMWKFPKQGVNRIPAVQILDLIPPTFDGMVDYTAVTDVPGVKVSSVSYYLTNEDPEGIRYEDYVPQHKDVGFVSVTMILPRNSTSVFSEEVTAIWDGMMPAERIYSEDYKTATFRYPFYIEANPDLILHQVDLKMAVPQAGGAVQQAWSETEGVSAVETTWTPQPAADGYEPWESYIMVVKLNKQPHLVFGDDCRFLLNGQPVTFCNQRPLPPFDYGFFVTTEFTVACNGGSQCPSRNFTDVPAVGSSQGWAHEGIDYAVKNGLFLGRSATKFAPWDPMDRSMLVTVLWRFQGKPAGGNTTFPDVPPRPDMQWCVEPISWAAANKIVLGYPDGTFGPLKEISRQDLMTILYRYTGEFLGIDTTPRVDLSEYPDSRKVLDYARDPMSWALATGLLSGRAINGKIYLDPAGDASRAQVATILMRYEKIFGRPQ